VRRPQLVPSQPVQKPVPAARSASAATTARSPYPRHPSRVLATSTRTANTPTDENSRRAGTAVLERSLAKRSWTSSIVRNARHAEARPSTSPTTTAAQATDEPMPAGEQAPTYRMPIVLPGLHRGARESMKRPCRVRVRRRCLRSGMPPSDTFATRDETTRPGHSRVNEHLRTFSVPAQNTCWSDGCGHVFASPSTRTSPLALEECSQTSSRCRAPWGSNASKISCAA